MIPDSELRSNEDLGNVTGFLTGVGSVESAYLLQYTRCVTEHRDWDVPAILTAIQYLTQLEVCVDNVHGSFLEILMCVTCARDCLIFYLLIQEDFS